MNLLLEGDDLEALLIRARREGGPFARIVRAEKVRRGGVMGFFAKEAFEVAVEVPGGIDDDEELALLAAPPERSGALLSLAQRATARAGREPAEDGPIEQAAALAMARQAAFEAAMASDERAPIQDAPGRRMQRGPSFDPYGQDEVRETLDLKKILNTSVEWDEAEWEDWDEGAAVPAAAVPHPDTEAAAAAEEDAEAVAAAEAAREAEELEAARRAAEEAAERIAARAEEIRAERAAKAARAAKAKAARAKAATRKRAAAVATGTAASTAASTVADETAPVVSAPPAGANPAAESPAPAAPADPAVPSEPSAASARTIVPGLTRAGGKSRARKGAHLAEVQDAEPDSQTRRKGLKSRFRKGGLDVVQLPEHATELPEAPVTGLRIEIPETPGDETGDVAGSADNDLDFGRLRPAWVRPRDARTGAGRKPAAPADLSLPASRRVPGQAGAAGGLMTDDRPGLRVEMSSQPPSGGRPTEAGSGLPLNNGDVPSDPSTVRDIPKLLPLPPKARSGGSARGDAGDSAGKPSEPPKDASSSENEEAAGAVPGLAPVSADLPGVPGLAPVLADLPGVPAPATDPEADLIAKWADPTGPSLTPTDAPAPVAAPAAAPVSAPAPVLSPPVLAETPAAPATTDDVVAQWAVAPEPTTPATTETPQISWPVSPVGTAWTPDAPSETPQSAPLETPQFETPQFETPQFGAPQLETPPLAMPSIEAPPVMAPPIAAPPVTAPQSDSPHDDAPQATTPQVTESPGDTPWFAMPQAESQQAESQQAGSQQAGSQQASSPQDAAPAIAVPQLAAPPTQPPQPAAPQLEVPKLAPDTNPIPTIQALAPVQPVEQAQPLPPEQTSSTEVSPEATPFASPGQTDAFKHFGQQPTEPAAPAEQPAPASWSSPLPGQGDTSITSPWSAARTTPEPNSGDAPAQQWSVPAFSSDTTTTSVAGPSGNQPVQGDLSDLPATAARATTVLPKGKARRSKKNVPNQRTTQAVTPPPAPAAAPAVPAPAVSEENAAPVVGQEEPTGDDSGRHRPRRDRSRARHTGPGTDPKLGAPAGGTPPAPLSAARAEVDASAEDGFKLFGIRLGSRKKGKTKDESVAEVTPLRSSGVTEASPESPKDEQNPAEVRMEASTEAAIGEPPAWEVMAARASSAAAAGELAAAQAVLTATQPTTETTTEPTSEPTTDAQMSAQPIVPAQPGAPATENASPDVTASWASETTPAPSTNPAWGSSGAPTDEGPSWATPSDLTSAWTAPATPETEPKPEVGAPEAASPVESPSALQTPETPGTPWSSSVTEASTTPWATSSETPGIQWTPSAQETSSAPEQSHPVPESAPVAAWAYQPEATPAAAAETPKPAESPVEPEISWTTDFATPPTPTPPIVTENPFALRDPEPITGLETGMSPEPATAALPPLAPITPLPVPEAGSALGFPVTESPFTPEPTPEPTPEVLTVVPHFSETNNEPDPEPTSEPAVSDHQIDFEQVRAGVQAGLETAEEVAAGLALATDQLALNGLGVPTEWTANLQRGDRFMAVVQMLGQMPEPAISEDVQVIAVIGPADVVGLEAARTALDLPHEGGPRKVVTVPSEVGPERLEAMDLVAATRPVVVSIPVDGILTEDAGRVRKVLQNVEAEAVIAVLDGTRPLAENQRWVKYLGKVDAVAVDGGLESGEPAAVLQLGVPVVRLDGIAVDRIGWAAVLCTQLAVGGATS